MKNSPTNPIDYLKDQLGLKDLHRFISTHPDMDHMDGFDRLCNEIELINFWHTGVYRNAPSFSGSRYKEDDWNSYCRVRNGERDHITVITPKAGCRFSCANGLEGMDHDSLYILSPDPSLVDEAASSGNLNDGSYVILYKSPIGDIIFAGDAHDKTWKYILENYETSVSNCKFLLAPHHGRHSGANFEFLDVVRPSLTLFGCASSEYLAYSAWNNRGLNFITQNQCGNVILEDFNGELGIYIENKSFINNRFAIPTVNTQGYYLYGSL